MTKPDTIVDDEKIREDDNTGAENLINESREYVLGDETRAILNDSNESSDSEMNVDEKNN
jgi:hypothetical protein